jgi:hypothetical protein
VSCHRGVAFFRETASSVLFCFFDVYIGRDRDDSNNCVSKSLGVSWLSDGGKHQTIEVMLSALLCDSRDKLLSFDGITVKRRISKRWFYVCILCIYVYSVYSGQSADDTLCNRQLHSALSFKHTTQNPRLFSSLTFGPWLTAQLEKSTYTNDNPKPGSV